MDLFYATLGFCGAICLCVMGMALFFTALGIFRKKMRGTSPVRVEGFLREGKIFQVDLGGDKQLDQVRFIGFTAKYLHTGDDLPFNLTSMAIFETGTGERILVRSDMIQMIREVG